MKRFISIFIIVAMMFTFASACNKDDKADPKDKTKDVFEGRLLQPYVKINRTGKYMITTEMQSDNQTIPVTITVSGANKKMITLTIEMKDGSELPLSLILNGERAMLVFSSHKAYGDIGASQLKNLREFLHGAYIQLTSLSYKDTGTLEVDGEEYTYEDYYNPVSQTNTRFLFKSGTLVMTGGPDSSGNGKYLKIGISGDVTDEMFDVPNEFTRDQATINKFVSELDKM
jgi:hypothetical protein